MGGFWYSKVWSIMRCENYTGNALLQKYYSENFLTKRQRVNNGEVTQYYVEGSHPAIVSKRTFDMAQVLLDKGAQASSRNGEAFSMWIYCGDCGSVYSPKIWHSNDKYRRRIWQCRNKFNNERKCSAPHYTDNELKRLSLHAISCVMATKDSIIRVLDKSICTVFDTSTKESEIDVLKMEMDKISTYLESEMGRAEGFVGVDFLIRYTEEKKKVDMLLSEIAEANVKKAKIRKYIDVLNGKIKVN